MEWKKYPDERPDLPSPEGDQGLFAVYERNSRAFQLVKITGWNEENIFVENEWGDEFSFNELEVTWWSKFPNLPHEVAKEGFFCYWGLSRYIDGTPMPRLKG